MCELINKSRTNKQAFKLLSNSFTGHETHKQDSSYDHNKRIIEIKGATDVQCVTCRINNGAKSEDVFEVEKGRI